MSVCFEKVVTFNVLSIISAAFAACLLAIAVPAAITYTYVQTYCGDAYYTTQSYNSYHNCYGMVNILTIYCENTYLE